MHVMIIWPYNNNFLCIQVILESLEELGIKHHSKGTVVSVEGPRFSTKAESNMYRLWGADVINMTSVPEVFDLTLISSLCVICVPYRTFMAAYIRGR